MKIPFIPTTYVKKTTRILHQETEAEYVHYFVDTNHESGHVSLEDGFQRIIPIDIRVIPELIEVLKAEYNSYMEHLENLEIEAEQKEQSDAAGTKANVPSEEPTSTEPSVGGEPAGESDPIG